MSEKDKKREEEFKKITNNLDKLIVQMDKNKSEKKKKAKSEFGKGLTVCVGKFLAHYENGMLANPMFCVLIMENKDKQTQKDMADGKKMDAKHSYDFGKMHYWRYFYAKTYSIYEGDFEKSLSQDLSLFMNGASDHLYGIEVPKAWEKKKIAKMVKELQNKALDIGYGAKGMFGTGGNVTVDEIMYLGELAEDILLEVDKLIGLKPDIGKW